MGTAEIAWKAVGAALLARGMPFTLAFTFSCDVDEMCHDVLRAYGSGHIFGDIIAMLGIREFDTSWTFARKCRSILAAPARNVAWCFKCGGHCHVAMGDIDTSGSPCQDWSSAGRGEQHHGKRIHCLLAWMRLHLIAQTAVLIHENVIGFNIDLLFKFMGHMYYIFSVEAGPEDVGWSCCKRPRVYIALLHRAKTRLLADPVMIFHAVCQHLRARAPLRIRDCLIAAEQEIRYEELNLAALRSGVAAASLRSRWAVPARLGRLAYVLSQGEVDRCHEYARLYFYRTGLAATSDVDLVCNLGDNPAGGWLTWSAPPLQMLGCTSPAVHRLPTLRRNWTVQWLPAHGRWLMGSERLVSMGFPATTLLAQRYGLSGQFVLPWAYRHLLGNGMHMANIGVWQACVAACVEVVA